MRASMLCNGRAVAAAIAVLAVLGTPAPAQERPKDTLGLPQNATALEGLPHVRVDVTRDATERHELAPAEAAESRLAIRVSDGRFYWSSRDNRPLAPSSSGGFTYLSSTDPGRYIRIRRVNDTLTYVEHIDTESGSVTYWGELRVVMAR